MVKRLATRHFHKLGTYSTIAADPPWPYPNANSNHVAMQQRLTKSGRRMKGPNQLGYPVMSMVDLKALPVADHASPNAHLYLWTTNAFMSEAHELARAWGFHPKTILTWVKTHRNDPTRVSMKTGYYFRGATEHILFCVRGSLKLQVSEGVPTAFLWPRIGQHSVKPDEFYKLVEKCSPPSYLEMFSRRRRYGWDAFGNQIEHPRRRR